MVVLYNIDAPLSVIDGDITRRIIMTTRLLTTLSIFLLCIIYKAFPFSTRILKVRSSSLYAIGPINEDIFDVITPVRIEGNSLQTWSFSSGLTKRVQVSCKSIGRPIEASIELWQTPSYTPTKFKVECEDGSENIVHSIIELPEGHPVTVAVYNTEGQEFPMDVSVLDMSNVESPASTFPVEQAQYIEGNKSVKSYTFGYGVESVEILLQTKTRNMKAMIEILQGPKDDNEIIEVETDNASLHPFYTVIQTPGGANTLRIVNESPIEFPLMVNVRPFDTVSDEKAEFNYGGPYF